MITVSLGNAHDIASIMPVMTDAFDPAFGEAWTSAQCLSALTIPGCQLLIARNEDGSGVGFAITRWVLDEEELLMIAVSPEWQRKNVATILLDEILALACEAGRSKLFLEVRDGNNALTFYQKRGFEAIGHRKQYYRGDNEARHDAITMGRSI